MYSDHPKLRQQEKFEVQVDKALGNDDCKQFLPAQIVDMYQRIEVTRAVEKKDGSAFEDNVDIRCLQRNFPSLRHRTVSTSLLRNLQANVFKAFLRTVVNAAAATFVQVERQAEALTLHPTRRLRNVTI